MSTGKFIQHKHGNVALDNLKEEFEGLGEIIIKTTEKEEAIITKNSKDEIVEFLPVNRFKTINGEDLIVKDEDNNIEINIPNPTEVTVNTEYNEGEGVKIAEIKVDEKVTEIYAPIFNIEESDELKELLKFKVDTSAFTAHTSDNTIHVTKDLQDKWNKAASEINVFLNTESGATTALDSIIEINNYIDEHGTHAKNMQTAITANDAAIKAEVSARTAADEVLQSAINANANAITALTKDVDDKLALKADAIDLTSAVNDLTSAIDTEASAREDADATLQTAITANDTAIKAEVSARTAADEVLQNAINAETDARENSFNELSKDLGDKADKKDIEDISKSIDIISGNLEMLGAEHSNFLNINYDGETTIVGDIVIEGTVISRKGFYEVPEGDPNVSIESYVTRTELDNVLSELGATVITAHTADTDVHVTPELQDKWNKAADEIDAFLNTESGVTEVIESIMEIQEYLKNNGTEVVDMQNAITTNAGAISDEVSARENADASLQSAIDAETAARESAISTITATVDTKAAQTDLLTVSGAVAANAAAISAETDARKDVVSDIYSSLQDIEAQHVNFLNINSTGKTIIEGDIEIKGTVISRKGFYEDPEGDPNIEIETYVTENRLNTILNNTLSELGSTLSADKGYYISGITQENGKIISVGVAELPKPTSDGEVVTNVQISDTLSEGEVIAKVIIDNNETILYAPKYSSEINTLTSQYNTLSGSYETINSQISDLTSENETITNNIQGNLKNIENVSGSVNTLSTELNTHKSDNSHLSENDRNIINNLSNDSINFSGKTITADAYYQTSDERMKVFGDEIEVDFEKLSKLRKSYFAYNTNPNKQEIGVSAQEVKEIYPEIVNEDENGILSVDYCKLSVIALSAVDKLNERLNKIEEKLGL